MALFRHFFPKRSPVYRAAAKYVKNAHGLEIGGPSYAFSAQWRLPFYTIAGSIDGCNFAEESVWADKADGGAYIWDTVRKPGTLHICEGNNLTSIADASYDFLLSSHNLEHFANPIKALIEWRRVIKPTGALIVLVPQKELTFDRHRETTSFNHLVDDFRKGISEADMTHYDEIVSKTDISIYPEVLARSPDAFTTLSKNNINNRCMHHHVFDYPLMQQLADFCELNLIRHSVDQPNHLSFLLCPRKPKR